MRRRDSGSVLILALWSVCLLAVLGVTIGSMTRQKLTLIDRLAVSESLVPLALSGVERAKSVLREPDLDPGFDTLRDAWASNDANFLDAAGAEGVFSVVGETVAGPDGAPLTRYGLIDEERKLNVNKADAASIARLLRGVFEQIIVEQGDDAPEGLDEEDALEIAYAITDWRDQDSVYQHPEYGAEDDDYDDLNPAYEAKDAPIEALEELLVVKGMRRDIFDKIERFMTPYGSGAVNLNTAPREVLSAIGLGDALMERILAHRAGEDRIPLTSDDLRFSSPESIADDLERLAPVPAHERAALEAMVSENKIGTASQYFSARSVATLERNGAALEAVAVMDRKGKVQRVRLAKPKWPSRG